MHVIWVPSNQKCLPLCLPSCVRMKGFNCYFWSSQSRIQIYACQSYEWHADAFSMEKKKLIYCNHLLWLMTRKCTSESFWLQLGGFDYALSKDRSQKPSINKHKWFIYAFSCHDTRWSSCNKWLQWTSFLLVYIQASRSI